MVVGYELGKLGYDYQVLEARDRVGGLQWAVKRGAEHTEVGGERQVCTFDEGQYINVGPWRIPYSHEAVLNYCRELNVPVQVFLNESDANYFYFEGNARGPLSNKKIRMREIKADVTGADQRAVREGARSEEARSAADRRRSEAARQLPRQPGLPR